MKFEMEQTPPPPPPPPPCLPKIQKSKTYESSKTVTVDKSHTDEQTLILKNIFYDSNSKVLSYYKPIHSILQNGPSCGIVALSMASQCLKNVDAQDLLEAAKQRGFTKSGEMFSTYNMAALASACLNCDASVINNLELNKTFILTHICCGWPALIPYDADKNHEPCLNKGKSAHWAVVSGLCFALPENCELQSQLNFKEIQPGLDACISDNVLPFNKLLDHVPKIYVYAHQGKSKHLAAWDINMLLQSNNNLNEVTKKYDIQELVLPENNNLAELRDKAVLLKNRDT